MFNSVNMMEIYDTLCKCNVKFYEGI